MRNVLTAHLANHARAIREDRIILCPGVLGDARAWDNRYNNSPPYPDGVHMTGENDDVAELKAKIVTLEERNVRLMEDLQNAETEKRYSESELFRLQKEDESSDLKNELVSRQIEQERNTKAYEELEAENRRLLLEKTKLEAALEQNAATENKEEKE